MKRKFKNKLIVLLFALVSLFVLAGCRFSQTLDEFIEAENIKVKITYYVNGGKFVGSSNTSKDLYFHENDMPLNITESPDTADENFAFGKGSIYITQENYSLLGWYYVTEVIDEEKGLCTLGEEFDFTQALKGGDELIEIKLAAKWQKNEGVLIKLGQIIDEDKNELVDATIEVGEAKSYIAEDATSFQKGDVLGEIDYNRRGELSKESADPGSKLFTVKDNAYTFYDYYADPECTTPVVWDLIQGEEQTTIYAKYLKGNWKFVSTSNEVKEMFDSGLEEGINYWLLNDVVYNNSSSIRPLTETKGTLMGNGFTIENLKFSATPSSTPSALFGDITETANLKDVTLKNLTLKYETRGRNAINTELYFVFLSLHEQAKVSNVNIYGTMSIEIITQQPSEVINMKDGMDHCLFGGYTTDEDYKTESENQGFIVHGDVNEIITLNIE